MEPEEKINWGTVSVAAITWIVGLAVIYLLMAFILWDIDARNWGFIARAIVVFTAVFWSAYLDDQTDLDQLDNDAESE